MGCEEMGEFIRLEELCYTYTDHNGGEVLALDHINLTVQQGEFVAVIGTNGSGKSTLARHLNALLLPTGGDCFVAGINTKEAEQVWSIRQQVGMVFQNPDNQIVATIVEEDVAFGPENLGLPSAEIVARVNEALRLVGMEEYRRHAPHLLSGGQKQRVAIAGVLAVRPQCLLLDEPTAMLDPQGRKEVLATAVRLHQEEKITVIIVTHFMEEALAADRLVVMDQGRLVLQGTPAAVFSRVAEIKALGLDVPVAADIAWRLREQGLALPADIITEEALAEALLCPSS